MKLGAPRNIREFGSRAADHLKNAAGYIARAIEAGATPAGQGRSLACLKAAGLHSTAAGELQMAIDAIREITG
jgi:ribosomal protein L13E